MIWAGILQGLVAAIGYGLAIMALLRLLRRVEPTFVVLGAAAVVYILFLAAVPLAGLTLNFWVYSTSYWFWILSFLMAFGAIYKSLSLRMLLMLLERADRSYSAEGFRQDYVFGDSFINRLDLIVGKGLAEREGEAYRLSPTGETSARRIVRLQRFFGIMRSG